MACGLLRACAPARSTCTKWGCDYSDAMRWWTDWRKLRGVLAAVGIRVNLAEKAAERGPKKGSSEAPWFVAKGEKRIQNGGSSVSLVRSLRAGRYCSRYSSSRRIP